MAEKQPMEMQKKIGRKAGCKHPRLHGRARESQRASRLGIASELAQVRNGKRRPVCPDAF